MKNTRKGFTIIELLVVILLISMLVVFVVPKMLQQVPEAKMKIAKAKMANIEVAIGKFYLDCGRYPDDTEGLGSLIEAPAGLEEKWKGPYLKRSELLDPWGNPYEYRAEGEINPGNFDLISYGADGQVGGEGENEDIYND